MVDLEIVVLAVLLIVLVEVAAGIEKRLREIRSLLQEHLSGTKRDAQ